jgi:hypothetical protein
MQVEELVKVRGYLLPVGGVCESAMNEDNCFFFCHA